MIKNNNNMLVEKISKKNNKAENKHFQNMDKIKIGAVCFIADHS